MLDEFWVTAVWQDWAKDKHHYHYLIQPFCTTVPYKISEKKKKIKHFIGEPGAKNKQTNKKQNTYLLT